jgi:hypothetical protein
MPVSETLTSALTGQPGEAVSQRLRRRALLVSGMGFFTDAYDLFVIGIVSTLLKTQWHLGTNQLALLNAVMLGAAFLGAIVFGRLADKIGRTRVYWMSAALMVIAAAGSALAPSLAVLIAFRFLLGFGVGGDYPVSAVLMSEYAGRSNRGRMVGLVFSAQAVGLIIGPLAALALLGGGAGPAATWRILLGLGAIPAAAAVWLRRKMPEPPRYQAQAGRQPQPGPRACAARIGPAGVPGQPQAPGTARRDGGLLVPARLRLLRQHDLHPADHRPAHPVRLPDHHDRDPARDLRHGLAALSRHPHRRYTEPRSMIFSRDTDPDPAASFCADESGCRQVQHRRCAGGEADRVAPVLVPRPADCPGDDDPRGCSRLASDGPSGNGESHQRSGRDRHGLPWARGT